MDKIVITSWTRFIACLFVGGLFLAAEIANAQTPAVAQGIAEAKPATTIWPQWRGPNRDGILRNAAAWPDSLDDKHLQRVWQTEKLGPSYSGTIVAADCAYTTATEKGKEEIVYAFDRVSGKELWRTSWPGSMAVPFFAASNGSWIRSTPAYDAESLYVGGMRDLLVCLDAKTGTERWRMDFVKEFKSTLPAFGFVSSPLIVDDELYVQAGGGLVKLDKRTGKVLWRVLDDGGGMNGSAFSSPVLATVAGKVQIVTQMRETLAGVDPQNGEILWQTKVEAFRGMNIFTPVVYRGDSIFTSTYGGRTELRKIGGDGGQLSASVAWTEKSQGYMSTPIILGNHAYMHLRNQRFCCVDLEAGKVLWTTQPFGNYWSMVANGDKILALDERGELFLIKANPEKFELIAKRQVAEESAWAHLAICGEEIFIRELNTLNAWHWAKLK